MTAGRRRGEASGRAARAPARVLAAALLGAVSGTTLAAQTEGSVVAALSGSPRAQSLGDAAVALAGDAGSLFANPAAIATVRRWAVEGSFERHLAGAQYTTAAFAARFGRLTWGIGAQAFTFGDEPEIIGGTSTGATFTAADLLATGTLVYRFSLIAVGASAKYARQSVADWAADTWAADVGAVMAVYDIAELGCAVQNLGGGLDANAGLPTRTRLAYKLLSPIPNISNSLEIPYCHHERWDGKGYPRGLRYEQIPLSARIFSIADVWDALLSDRPYRVAWTRTDTIEYIFQQRGFLFQPELVDVFLNLENIQEPKGQIQG